jgi:hypothetical protein
MMNVPLSNLNLLSRLKKNKQHDRDLEPMSLEQFHEMIEQAKLDKANGRVVSHEEVKRTFKSWK